MPAPAPIPSAEEVTAQSAAQGDPNKYVLYRCQACGKRIFKFDRPDHTRKVQGGKEPGYTQLGT